MAEGNHVNEDGLVLHGDIGSGKAFMASAIANRIIERCYPIEFDNASKRRQKALSSQLALEEKLGIAKADG